MVNQPELEKFLSRLHELGLPRHIVAVDCPSGIDCDSGETAPYVLPAEVTICMDAVKIGLLKFPANNYVGRLEVVDLGLRDRRDAVRLPAHPAAAVRLAFHYLEIGDVSPLCALRHYCPALAPALIALYGNCARFDGFPAHADGLAGFLILTLS